MLWNALQSVTLSDYWRPDLLLKNSLFLRELLASRMGQMHTIIDCEMNVYESFQVSWAPLPLSKFFEVKTKTSL